MNLSKLLRKLVYLILEPLVRWQMRRSKTPHTRQNGCLLYVGQRVMVRSNEPEPLAAGEIVELYDCKGKWATPIPIVRFDSGWEGMCMGVVIPYLEPVFKHLELFKPIEQWNMLVGTHAQISEKYGVRYRTHAEILRDVEGVQAQLDQIIRSL